MQRHRHRLTLAVSIATAATFTMQPFADSLLAHDLADKAIVRIQSDQLSPGWHEGTVQVQGTGCALVWTIDHKRPGGKTGLALTFIKRLQRRQGTVLTDESVPFLIKRVPASCQEGNG